MIRVLQHLVSSTKSRISTPMARASIVTNRKDLPGNATNLTTNLFASRNSSRFQSVRSFSSVPLDFTKGTSIDKISQEFEQENKHAECSSLGITILANQAAEFHASHDLAWYNVNGYVMDLLHFSHDITGLSYASSIAFITVGVRVFVLVPVGIFSLRIDPTLEDDIDVLAKRLDQNPDSQERHKIAKEIDEMRKRARRIQLRRILMPVVSVGTFFTMWSGLRHMCVYYPSEMAMGGHQWFIDLTQHDPLFYLPVLSTLAFYTMGEVGADQVGKPSRQLSSKWKTFWRGFRLFSFFVLMDAPAAIFCYWIPNAVGSVMQTLFFSHPKVKETLRLSNEFESPKIEATVDFVDTTKNNLSPKPISKTRKKRRNKRVSSN